jgi:hypothetical protein
VVVRYVDGRRQPLVEQNERGLFPAGWSEAEEEVAGELAEDVYPALSSRREAGAGHRCVELGPGAGTVFADPRRHNLRGAREDVVVDAELALAGCDAPLDSRGGQAKDGADQLEGDEVQRPTHRPRADDLAPLDGGLHLAAGGPL